MKGYVAHSLSSCKYLRDLFLAAARAPGSCGRGLTPQPIRSRIGPRRGRRPRRESEEGSGESPGSSGRGRGGTGSAHGPARHREELRGRGGAGGRRLHRPPGRGRDAGRRERRRQVDPQEHPLRGDRARCRRHRVLRPDLPGALDGARRPAGDRHDPSGAEPVRQPVGGREHPPAASAAAGGAGRLQGDAGDRGDPARGSPRQRDRPERGRRRAVARRAPAGRDREVDPPLVVAVDPGRADHLPQPAGAAASVRGRAPAPDPWLRHPLHHAFHGGGVRARGSDRGPARWRRGRRRHARRDPARAPRPADGRA